MTEPHTDTKVSGVLSGSIELAVRGLVLRDGQVLLVRMAYGPLKGKWLVPGGLVGRSETVIEAAVREVREESGVEMAVTGVLGLRHLVDDQRNNLLTILVGQYVGGEPKPDGREVDDARFFTIAEALALENLYPVARLAITLIAKGGQGLQVHRGPNPHFQFMLPANVNVPADLVPAHP